MPVPHDIIAALGGLGLFLLGMGIMTDALRQLAGASMTRWLARSTRSPASGALTGALSTAVIQSSSATTVAAVGFVGAGLLTFEQALGVLFGANLGTTITGWMVALVGFKLDVGTLAPLLVFVGALMRLLWSGRMAAMGAGLAGFGLIFTGIDALQSAMEGFAATITPDTFPPDNAGGRLRLLGLGLLVSVITQSSSAGVATAITAVHAGAISFPQAAAMVIGMDVGTTATALLATLGGDVPARRTGYAHVVFNLMTGIMAFFLLQPFARAVDALMPGALVNSPHLALVAFHTFFNGLGVVLVLPVTRRFAQLMEQLVGGRSKGPESLLDKSLLTNPTIALEACAAATRRLASGVFRFAARDLRRPMDAEARRDQCDSFEAQAASIRRFLAEVQTDRSDPRNHSAHVSLIDALDHIFRLTERMESRETTRRRRPSRSPIARVVQQRAREVAAPLLVAALGLRDRGAGASGSSLSEALEKQMGTAKALRLRIFEEAAANDITSEQAMAFLDDVRRFGRVAYHAQHVVDHLALTDELRSSQSAPTSGD